MRAISVSAQGYQTKLYSNVKGRRMLGLAIARLLHTVFVPAQQKWKCSVITCLFMRPLKDVKCSTLLSNLSPPSVQILRWIPICWVLNAAHFAFQALLVLQCGAPLKAWVLLFQQGSGSHSPLSAPRQHCL